VEFMGTGPWIQARRCGEDSSEEMEWRDDTESAVGGALGTENHCFGVTGLADPSPELVNNDKGGEFD